jgi:cephalosporin hydroxylase
MVVGYMSEHSRSRLHRLIHAYDINSVIEVGSFVGLSACFFAERVGSVLCIDTFDAANTETMNPVGVHVVENQYRTFLDNTQDYPNIRHMVADSLTAAGLPFYADMVYLDGDHTHDAVVADIEAWKPHARKVLCGDDANDPRFGVSAALETLDMPDYGERIWWQSSS